MAQTSLNSTGVASSGALSLQSNGTTEAIGISTAQVATLAQNPILTSGTANGVGYLNGSKVLTTGSALTFDGTNLKVGTSGTTNIYGPATTGRMFVANSDSTAYMGVYGSAYGTGQNSIIQFVAGTTNTLTFDSSGNLGLGVTPSAWNSARKAFQIGAGSSLVASTTGASFTEVGANTYLNSGAADIYIGSDYASKYRQANGAHNWYTAASGTAGNAISFTQAMTLDASGNLGVGRTNPGARLSLAANSSPYQLSLSYDTSAAGFVIGSPSSDALAFYNWAGTERARIDSSGNLLVGTTSGVANAVLVASKSVADYAVRFINSNATPYGLVLNYSGAAPNSTAAEFLRCVDSSTDRMFVRSNGGIANYSANNVNLSDERTKTDIQDAGSYLAKICAIPVRTFKYKDQTDDLLNLGCIAQEVEAVAPELVDVSGFGETPEDGVPLKAIYQTDLQYALMKCIQEQQALITSLTARITALES